jgi:hypothetical protein
MGGKGVRVGEGSAQGRVCPWSMSMLMGPRHAWRLSWNMMAP